MGHCGIGSVFIGKILKSQTVAMSRENGVSMGADIKTLDRKFMKSLNRNLRALAKMRKEALKRDKNRYKRWEKLYEIKR